MAIHYPSIDYAKKANLKIGITVEDGELWTFHHDPNDSESDLRDLIESENPRKKVLTTHLQADRNVVAGWVQRCEQKMGFRS